MIQLDLIAQLDELGIDALIVESDEDLDGLEPETMPQVALLDMAALSDADASDCVKTCAELKLPIIAVVPREFLPDFDFALSINDFVLDPPDIEELAARVRRITQKSESARPANADVIAMGDLSVNPTTYEVALKGKRVNLRFKEYELLRLLIANPGRVYTREALLSRIWGYDYLGGTRTVDVHIRRLRSKIEDADHEFIETIWNVGYRFRDLR